MFRRLVLAVALSVLASLALIPAEASAECVFVTGGCYCCEEIILSSDPDSIGEEVCFMDFGCDGIPG